MEKEIHQPDRKEAGKRKMTTYVVKRKFVCDNPPERVVEKMVKIHMEN